MRSAECQCLSGTVHRRYVRNVSERDGESCRAAGERTASRVVDSFYVENHGEWVNKWKRLMSRARHSLQETNWQMYVYTDVVTEPPGSIVQVCWAWCFWFSDNLLLDGCCPKQCRAGYEETNSERHYISDAFLLCYRMHPLLPNTEKSSSLKEVGLYLLQKRTLNNEIRQ